MMDGRGSENGMAWAELGSELIWPKFCFEHVGYCCLAFFLVLNMFKEKFELSCPIGLPISAKLS
jgi:hypothetical protein